MGSLLIEIVVWSITLVLLLGALYVVIGVLLLPLWGAGAALHAQRVQRFGRNWWGLPMRGVEKGVAFYERLTAPRDGSAYERRPLPARTSVADRQSDWARDLGRLMLWLLAIVGAIALIMAAEDAIVRPLGGGGAAVAAAAFAIVATLVTAAAAGMLAKRYRTGGRPPAFAFFVAVTIVLGFFSYSLVTEKESADRLVYDYCAFGSSSRRQLDSCQSHVTANEVRAEHTAAASFAMGDSDSSCGDDSGPFCQQVLDRRSLEDQAPPPGQ